MSLSFHDATLSVDGIALSFLDPGRLSDTGDLSLGELSIVEYPNLGELNVDPSLKVWLTRFSSIEEIEFRISF
jgi:hypothetical protein